MVHKKTGNSLSALTEEDIYSGGDLIQVYSSYRQDLLLHPEQAAAKEHLLLLHNHDDLIGMLHLVKVLTYRLLLTRKKESPARIEHATLLERRPGCSAATISFELSAAVPRKVPCRSTDSLAKTIPGPTAKRVGTYLGALSGIVDDTLCS